MRSPRKFDETLLRSLAPRGRGTLIRAFAPLLNELLPRYGITTPRRIAPFLANVFTETGGLRALEENLNYSAKRLRQVWPSRFKTAAKARRYAHNPEGLANLVYDRFGNRGHKGWGWRYRGRGPMMNTFVDNYREVKQTTGIDVVSDPDLLLDPRTGLEAACIYWKKRGCNELADAGKLRRIRLVINGGTHGLSTMRTYHRKILPRIQGLDLTNEVGKVTGVGVGGVLTAVFSTETWIAVTVGVIVAVVIMGYFVYRAHRRSKDVQEAISKAEGLEDLSDKLDLDLPAGNIVGGSGRDQLPGDDGYNPTVTS